MKSVAISQALRLATKILIPLAVAAIGSVSAQAQIFNVYQGSGVLENAWNDWSWCTDNLASTTYTLTGTQSIQVTYTGGYQGFSLESPTSFQAGYFTALNFYINGGSVTGRAINVQLVVNGGTTNAVDINQYVAGGRVDAGLWKRVSIPLSVFHLKPTDQISRFWLQEAAGTSQAPFWIDAIGWQPNGAPAPATVTANAFQKGKQIQPLMFGVNTAVWDSNLNSTTCENLIASGGFKGFRFPGGSLSDTYNWSTNKTNDGTVWATNFDAFASVAAPYGGQDVITVNYGTGTPALAASWVKYSNVTKKYGMKYWEIGNEVYGSWEADTHAKPNDPVTYATQFAQYYQQMKAVDPTIKIGAVVTPGEDAYVNYASESVKNPVTGLSHSGWTPVMLATLKSLNVQPDYIIYHRYPEYVNDCDFTLLAGTNGWISDIADLRSELTDYCGTTGSKTSIFCTETNCDAGPEGKQMVSIVNGLFLADSFGTMLQTECQAMIWWDLINGVNTTGDNGNWLYGWREYGDEGMFTPDFAHIYPMFYIEQLLNLFAASKDVVINSTSSYNLLSSYATTRADGSVRVMLVNKNPVSPVATTINLSGINPSPTAEVYTFGITEDNEARQNKPQTYTTSSITNATAKTNITVPPYSVTVVVFVLAPKA